MCGVVSWGRVISLAGRHSKSLMMQPPVWHWHRFPPGRDASSSRDACPGSLARRRSLRYGVLRYCTLCQHARKTGATAKHQLGVKTRRAQRNGLATGLLCTSGQQHRRMVRRTARARARRRREVERATVTRAQGRRRSEQRGGLCASSNPGIPKKHARRLDSLALHRSVSKRVHAGHAEGHLVVMCSSHQVKEHASLLSGAPLRSGQDCTSHSVHLCFAPGHGSAWSNKMSDARAQKAVSFRHQGCVSRANRGDCQQPACQMRSNMGCCRNGLMALGLAALLHGARTVRIGPYPPPSGAGVGVCANRCRPCQGTFAACSAYTGQHGDDRCGDAAGAAELQGAARRRCRAPWGWFSELGCFGATGSVQGSWMIRMLERPAGDGLGSRALQAGHWPRQRSREVPVGMHPEHRRWKVTEEVPTPWPLQQSFESPSLGQVVGRQWALRRSDPSLPHRCRDHVHGAGPDINADLSAEFSDSLRACLGSVFQEQLHITHCCKCAPQQRRKGPPASEWGRRIYAPSAPLHSDTTATPLPSHRHVHTPPRAPILAHTRSSRGSDALSLLPPSRLRASCGARSCQQPSLAARLRCPERANLWRQHELAGRYPPRSVIVRFPGPWSTARPAAGMRADRVGRFKMIQRSAPKLGRLPPPAPGSALSVQRRDSGDGAHLQLSFPAAAGALPGPYLLAHHARVTLSQPSAVLVPSSKRDESGRLTPSRLCHRHQPFCAFSAWRLLEPWRVCAATSWAITRVLCDRLLSHPCAFCATSTAWHLYSIACCAVRDHDSLGRHCLDSPALDAMFSLLSRSAELQEPQSFCEGTPYDDTTCLLMAKCRLIDSSLPSAARRSVLVFDSPF
ncbi:hypothetical protein K491DRAFT_748688 [Lophiostoma macrostomum CBS 122681]|uniref:Uncharacterized protein n=1 Tax=Lophiostoma macrostomum CBS 122681 TaxID=1314788 RepID=A0A6A6T5T1_9PLEO|nr:hypothetical protein K491DRAFT_748688 [Lophiostoma macrostomum CBS 122681]